MLKFTRITAQAKSLILAGAVALAGVTMQPGVSVAQDYNGPTFSQEFLTDDVLIQKRKRHNKRGERKRDGRRGDGRRRGGRDVLIGIDDGRDLKEDYRHVRKERRHERRHERKHRRGRNHDGGIYIELGGHRRHRGHRRGCSPRRALDKAWSMGVNRPYVDRVGRGRIVIKGRSHGYRAKVVFKKRSRHCRVIKTRGLRNY